MVHLAFYLRHTCFSIPKNLSLQPNGVWLQINRGIIQVQQLCQQESKDTHSEEASGPHIHPVSYMLTN